MKKIPLDINKPEDARIFIKDALNGVLKEMAGGALTHLHLADGTVKDVNDLDDTEAVQYAWELLPIFQARHPDNVKLEYEQ